MNMIFVLLFVLLISAYTYAERMPDSTVYATTYIVRGDSVFVKSDPAIVLGELKFKGQVYIYRKDVEIASFRSGVTIESLRELDSIFIEAAPEPATRGALIKDCIDSTFLGGSIMYTMKYPPVSFGRSVLPMKTSKIQNADYQKFDIQGRVVRYRCSGITITNRRLFMTFRNE